MRPNVLWIITTQWRGLALGYMGDCNARTPELDRLAASSIRFDEAVTPHPSGPLARAALMTGCLSPRNGVADYFDPLPIRAQTVAHDMASLGYRTAFFGKWHLGRKSKDMPLVGEDHARILVPEAERGGFGFWEGFEGGFLLNGPWFHGTTLPEPIQFPGYQSDVVVERALRWIRANDLNHPWFCAVSLEPPHPPYSAPAAGHLPPTAHELSLRNNVPEGPVRDRVQKELPGYYAHIAATDSAIGRLIRGIGDARVIFTSVHGDMHGSHGLFRKGWPYEESVRVPLLIRAPQIGGFVPGQSPRAAVSLVDLRRITFALAGDLPANVTFPAVAQISMPTLVRLRDQCDRVWWGVRTQAEKLVLTEGKPWLYFRLDRDPLEMDNQAMNPQWADRVARLAQKVDYGTGIAPGS